MPIYEYRCRPCDLKHLAHLSIRQYENAAMPNCPICGQPMRRDWNLQIAPVMQEQWAPPLGQAVSSERQFADVLKAKEDEASARLGYDVTYAVGSREDTKPAGIDD